MARNSASSTKAPVLAAGLAAVLFGTAGVVAWTATGDPVFLGGLGSLLGPPFVFFWNRRAEQRG